MWWGGDWHQSILGDAGDLDGLQDGQNAVGAGETGGAVTTIVVGPVPFATTSGSPVTIAFDEPIKLPDETSLTASSADAEVVWILAEGFTR